MSNKDIQRAEELEEARFDILDHLPCTRTAYCLEIDAARWRIICRALILHRGSRIRTAQALGIQRTYLQRLLRPP